MKKLTYPPVRLGWLAGIIEGEGWIGNRNGRPTIQVIMTDEDVVRRVHEWSGGLGTVVGPSTPKDQRKPYWSWRITARDDAAAFIATISPYLGARRRARAQAVLAAYQEAGPTRGTSTTCGKGHDITPESGNLRVVTDSSGYSRRRCRKCDAQRMRDVRAKKAAKQ